MRLPKKSNSRFEDRTGTTGPGWMRINALFDYLMTPVNARKSYMDEPHIERHVPVPTPVEHPGGNALLNILLDPSYDYDHRQSEPRAGGIYDLQPVKRKKKK